MEKIFNNQQFISWIFDERYIVEQKNYKKGIGLK